MLRASGTTAARRAVAVFKPTRTATRLFSDEAEETDPKEIQAIVDAKVRKANQTGDDPIVRPFSALHWCFPVTPWFAREELAPALKTKPVEVLEENSAIQFLPEVVKRRKVHADQQHFLRQLTISSFSGENF